MIWLKSMKNKCVIWQLCQVCSTKIRKHMCEQNLLVLFFTVIFVHDTIWYIFSNFFAEVKKLYIVTNIAWKVLAQLCFSTISIRCDSHDPKPSPFWLHRHIFANTFPNLQFFSEEVIPLLTWPLPNALWKGNSFEIYNGCQFSHDCFVQKRSYILTGPD